MKAVRRINLALTVALLAAMSVVLFLCLAVSDHPSLAQGAVPQSVLEAGDGVSTSYVAVEFSDGTRSARRIAWTTPPSRTMALILAGFDVEYDAAFGNMGGA